MSFSLGLPERYGPNLVLVGRGGFGSVYRARDHSLGIDVAIKMPHRGDDAALAREVATELRAAARLRHPAIIDMLDAGTSSDGDPFLVMEYAGEGSLADYVDDDPPAWPTLLVMLDTVLAGLGHAHAHGLIHRDIKGDNILLARTPEGTLEPKLADFGLAKVEQRQGEYKQTRLQAGTLLYMAPEQFEAEDTASIHAGADLYAFGVLLYKIVAGTNPWGNDMGSMLVAKLGRSHRQLQARVDYPVPAGLDRVLDRLLARKPAYRYSLAADVRRDLAALSPLDPTVAPPDRRRSVGDFVSGLLGGGEGRLLPESPPQEPESPPRPPTVALAGLRLPVLVDRATEREQLWSAARAAAESPRGVAITGPSGAGRSRLVRWLTVTLEQAGFARTVQVRRRPGTSTSEALALGLRKSLGLGTLKGEDLRDRLGDWLESRRLGALSRWEPLLRWLDPWGAGDSTAAPARSPLAHHIAMFARLLRAESERGLCCVWFDDACKDGALADAALALLREARADHFPLLILFEAPGGSAANPALADFETLDVGPLGRADLAALLSDLVPAPFPIDELVDRARGNPLIAVEAARLEVISRQASQVTVRAPDAFGETLALATVPLSMTVSLPRIAQARLAAFVGVGAGLEARALFLALLALLPHRPDLALIEAVAVATGVRLRIQAVVDEARSAGLVRDPGDGSVVFANPALAEAADSRCGQRDDLDRLRTACAEALLNPSRASTETHRARAAELLLASGRRAQALPLLLRAAESHLAHDLERARDLYGCALEAAGSLGLSSDAPLLVEAALGAARAALNVGQVDDAEQVLLAVSADALVAGQRGRLLQVRASISLVRGRLDQALEEARASEVAFDASADRKGLARTAPLTAEALFRLGRIEESIAAFGDAIEVARLANSPIDALDCLWRRGRVLRIHGDRDAAQDDLTAALEAAAELQDLRLEGVVLRELGNLALIGGRHDEAEARYRASVERLERAGYRGETANTRVSLGELARARGQLAAARKEYAAALGVAKAYGMATSQLIALLDLALTELAMDRVSKAARRLEAVDTLFPGGPPERLRPYLDGVRLVVHAGRGEWEEAEATLESLVKSGMPPDDDGVWLLERTGDLAQAADETAFALDAFDAAHELADLREDEQGRRRLAEKLAAL